MQRHKYFGTDGIRGRVGIMPITPDFILKLGWAAGNVFSKLNSDKCSNQIIIGKDTRISGYMLESALESGLAAAGVSTALIGPVPTPAIAYLTRAFRAAAGIVISASHNPFYDNGIKFFSVQGTKLAVEVELSIERELNKCLTCVAPKFLGKANRIIDAPGRYIEFCKGTFPAHLSLRKLKIVLDCANGSTYHIAPSVFRELGADVVTVACHPNGFNINKECGTTDIRKLRAQVLARKADLGIAYDGDGDRVVMVDHLGNKVNGDQILYIIAKEKLYRKKLIGGVVGTTMSNTGLVEALEQLNIPFVRANVGDRCVISTLKHKGWYIGGESSGHIILLDKTTTGDGIVVALQILSAMVSNCVSLYELHNDMFLFPQILVNVYCSSIKSPLESKIVKKEIQAAKQELFEQGRVLLRKSGTEPYIRIMVEGKYYSKILCLANKIASAIRSAINSI
ncbi:phosphoglucosamine mutase [Candidatus Blochmannia ocreatus (nom. nud.)]|uniref:Phosphoglucosamine mutase n=1 Tax=Candidatus Blochmannia ocreatus (nom. nud.) TaxID=251538 RepID=A0ABY4SW17_9ENTR|nr:phosphoglucosamine mutase [Candidatus Blochmannia ocreatus]URJ25185.1 phosphoglucosamine mutase [Candidatus Blochmannia ocreatus]